MKKLILLDSDGTLRRSDGSISDKTIDKIKEVVKKGNYVVICTGRPRYHAKEIAEKIQSSPIIVCSNGSEIYDIEKNILINELYIENNICYQIIEYCYHQDIRMLITTEETEYVTKEIRTEKQVLLDRNKYINILENKLIKQCLFISKEEDKLNNLKNFISNFKDIKIVNENDRNKEIEEKWFSIGNIESSKGYALKKLANYLNIPISNTIAIGNDYNDISMFYESGYSVAVGNANDDIKELVDDVTLSNDEDGVAVFLDKIIKENL